MQENSQKDGGKMEFKKHIKYNKEIIAMIHLQALPGTPKNTLMPKEIIRKAIDEAILYQAQGIKTVMIENMHDVPYTKYIRAEIISIMSIIGKKIKELGLYCGIQILAGGNKEALAVAHAAGLDFIRAEGFVYAHIGDEGTFESCAGELLRYRKQIGAEDVLIFTDIKKKHSSHAITSDVSIEETAQAAHFFLSDGIIVTGMATGMKPSISDLKKVQNIEIKKLIGSGISADNLKEFFGMADIFIIGTYLKKDGNWENNPDKENIKKIINEFERLTNSY